MCSGGCNNGWCSSPGICIVIVNGQAPDVQQVFIKCIPMCGFTFYIIILCSKAKSSNTRFIYILIMNKKNHFCSGGCNNGWCSSPENCNI